MILWYLWTFWAQLCTSFLRMDSPYMEDFNLSRRKDGMNIQYLEDISKYSVSCLEQVFEMILLCSLEMNQIL
jgi:hypothetical protein